MTRSTLLLNLLARLFGGILMFALLFFLPAGTWFYWQGWLYIAVLILPMFFVMIYFLKHDPALLERRTHMREERKKQRGIILLFGLSFIIAFLFPGFDIRYGWSIMPAWVSILAAMVMFFSYMLVFRTMQVNSYLSRVVEVAQGQKVIDTDVYGIVRHRMYVGVVVLFLVSPIVLGSWWAIIPALPVIPLIAARIKDEEIALEQDLPGYKEYKQKVKFRLIPLVW